MTKPELDETFVSIPWKLFCLYSPLLPAEQLGGVQAPPVGAFRWNLGA